MTAGMGIREEENKTEIIVSRSDVGGLIQRTLNRVDPRLVDHGIRVAFLVSEMLEQQGKYFEQEKKNRCLTAMLHDIGAYKTEEIDKMVQFECDGVWAHSVYGYLFLLHLSPLGSYADAILHHHTRSGDLDRFEVANRELAQMIHLADRVDMYWQNSKEKGPLFSYLKSSVGSNFDGETVRLFMETEERRNMLDHLDGNHDLDQILKNFGADSESGDEYLKMLVYSIDFRSQHTVTHTITTTYISYETARLMGLPWSSLIHMYYGAMLHDLGKIGIPVEILEFPGKLSPQAMTIMRTHVDITEEIMAGCIDPVTTQIALRHHEKLNGTGYPRGLKEAELTLEEQIMAVADIVSALLGTRSYKTAFSKDRTLSIIHGMAEAGELNRQVVKTVEEHFEEILAEVASHCNPVLEIYQGMQKEYMDLMKKYRDQFPSF